MAIPQSCQGTRLIPLLCFAIPRLWLSLAWSKMASRAPAITSIIQDAGWMKGRRVFPFLSRKSAWSPIKHCETRLEAVLTFSFQPRARSPPREALPAKLPPPVLPGDCSGVLLLWPRLSLHSRRNALLNTRTRLVRIWGTPHYWRRWVLLVTVWRWLPVPESSSETSYRHPGYRLWCARLSCGNKWRPNPKSLIQCKLFSLFMLPVLWGLQGGLL